MANRAYLDKAADVRFRFFSRMGYPESRFAAARLGPVIVRDELSYRRELRLGDPYTVDLRARGLADDGSRFVLENTFRGEDGATAAVVRSEGVWFDLETRRPRAPPAELDRVQRAIAKTSDFARIPARPPRDHGD